MQHQGSPAPRMEMARSLAIPALVIVLLEAGVRGGWVGGESLPPPSEVVMQAFGAAVDGSLWTVTLETLASAFGGLAIGCVVGLALGVPLGLSEPLNRLTSLSIECFRPIPSIALLPVVMMIFGLGYRLEISLVAFATSWPILVFSRSAMAGVHPRLREVGRMLGFSPLRRLVKILLPAAAPFIFVGFRLSVGMALVVAVTVEISANPLGLGNAIMLAEQTMRPSLMFALIVWTGAMGFVLNWIVGIGERSLFSMPTEDGSAP